MSTSADKLSNKWTLWFHSPVDSSWGITSYKKIAEIATIEDFWNVYNRITSFIIENGMFFLMRDIINPMWEDSHNKDGGCWSFKIYKKNVSKVWLDMSIHLIANSLLVEKEKTITGISISPKKSFCIIKIWNNSSKLNSKSLLNTKIENMAINECLYKPHNVGK